MGTYGYISIIAMLCYGFLLLMFLTAKKNKIINSFLVVLLGLLFWTGGSAFMRAQFWPGCEFWYQVSLLGILSPYSSLENVRHTSCYTSFLQSIQAKAR